MDNPVNSIIWSPPFLGNGDGFVTTGPFANWDTPVGPLARNIAGGSRLLSKEVIRQILTRCRTSEISDPTAEAQFNLELAHGGPHVWVGGQMSGLNTAAHDPTFLLHHAFIDYLWEIFRIRQARRCGVNPNTDYPPMVPQHERDRVMDGFPQYRNIDGYRGYWTRFWFRYERSPSCSRFRPFCGTPYLRCDVRRGRCVSVARRMMDRNTGRTMMAFGAPSVARASRARAQASSLRIGPTFAAPPSDGRTQDAGFRRAGRRRRAVNQTENNPIEFIKPFVAPPSDGRTSDVLGFNIAHGIPSNDPVGPQPERPGEILYSYAAPMPLIPLPEFSNSSNLSNDHKDQLSLAQQSTDQTIYVPVGIIYRRSPNRPIAGSYCIGEMNGLMRIHVKSEGLTYQGVYENFTFVDTRPSYQASTIYMAVQVSKNSASDVLLTARDECGRMCQPVCLGRGEIFEPCDGTLQIDGNNDMYGRSVEEAARRLWTDSGLFGVGMSRRVQIQFICPMERRQLWDLNRMF